MDYEIMNAVLRGVISSQGGGGGITCEVVPITSYIEVTEYNDLLYELKKLCQDAALQDGDIVVITSSILAMAQGRIVPLDAIPKQEGLKGGTPFFMTDERLMELADQIAAKYDIHCQPKDIMLSDSARIGDQTILLLAPENPNQIAFEFSSLIHNDLGLLVDTVIKDSDAGDRRGRLAINTPTLVATPLGSTKGLSILEAMRVSAAGEVLMGKKNNIPMVVSHPANSVARNRMGIGEQRSNSFLDALSEPIVSSYHQRW